MVKEQKAVEWEVRKFYLNLYRREETNCRKEKILEKIGEVSRISEHESCKLEERITLEEVSKTLSNTRNTVAQVHFIRSFCALLNILCWERYMKYLKTGNYL